MAIEESQEGGTKLSTRPDIPESEHIPLVSARFPRNRSFPQNIPSSLAPQQGPGFPYEVSIPLTRKMHLKAAIVATLICDNLCISGNLSIHSLPTAWLESLPLPSDLNLGDIRNLTKNGYLLPGNLIAAARAGDQKIDCNWKR